MKSYSVFKRVVKDISTEKDGISFDITKVLWSIGTIIFFGLTIYTVILTPGSFNYVNWGIAFGGILAGGSAGVKIKESTEQDVPTPDGGSSETRASEKS